MKKFRMPARLTRISAFSMVELTIVIAIASILLVIGIPSFRTLIQNQRMTTTVNEFFAAISLARSEALQRGRRVDLVPLDHTDWANGWVVFIDNDNNQRVNSGDQIIFSHGPVFDGMTIKSAFTDSSKQYLAYNGTGRTRTNASSQSPQLGTVSFFLNAKIRRIKLNFLGRARTCNPETDTTCTGANDV
jgi:type IV fimbrial biogenesis protein FimT